MAMIHETFLNSEELAQFIELKAKQHEHLRFAQELRRQIHILDSRARTRERYARLGAADRYARADTSRRLKNMRGKNSAQA